MSSSSWFERNKKLSIGVGVAAVVGVAAAGIWYLNKKNGVSEPSSPSAGQAHASLAMKHHKAGSHALSISAWTSAIAADPENYKYYNNRAQSHMLLNNYEQALADADHAIQLNSNAAGGYYNRGRAALKLERFEDAASAFTSALEQSDASKIASQAQTLLKTCQDKIAKIRESRLKSVAGTKKPSPVNTTRVSPTNSGSGTASPRVGTTSPTTQKQTQQVAKVASNIVAHAKPVEPISATSVTAAAAAAIASASAPSPSSAPVSVPVAAASASAASTTQPDLSSAAKITAFLAEQNKIAQETQQKQKAVEVAQKIVDAVTHAAPAAAAAPAPTTTTNPTVSTTTPTNTVTIPSIFSPSNTKSESPVSPVSSDCGSTSNSGIFERSAVLLPSDGSAATTPPPQPKHVSRLSFIAPDLISDTTTIDAGEWDSSSDLEPEAEALSDSDSLSPLRRGLHTHSRSHSRSRVDTDSSDDDPLHSFAYQHAVNLLNQATPLQSAVPIDAFAAINTGTPLQSPPNVFRSISSEVISSTSTPTNANGSQSNSNSNTTSAATSPILLNKQATIKQQQPQANAPLAFSGENPLDEM